MAGIRHWIGEIHRRSLWQVLLVYAGAAWAVLEVVDTLTDLLRLPAWFPDLAVVLLLVGLPFVLATAVIQTSTDEALDGAVGPSEEAAPTPSDARRWMTWRNVLFAGVAVWALWGVVAAVWLGTRATPGDRVGAIAVLPLTTPTQDDRADGFAIGMTDQIITDLSRIGGLTVINAASALQYRNTEKSPAEIGRELDASVLLVGSIVREDTLVRVNARLVDAGTERSLWAESYRRPLRSVLALQGEIALDVARQVREAVGGTPEEGDLRAIRVRPVDPEAHALYLEARSLYRAPSPENLQAAIRLYRQALALDSAYAAAWAGLANAYLVAAHVVAEPADAFTAAIEASSRALTLDPGLAEAHGALADSRYHFGFAYGPAEAGFRRAIELSPSYATARWWYGGLLATLQRFDESLDQIERARRLDPRASIIPAFHARVLYYARRYEEAATVARQSAEAPYPVQLTHGALAIYRLGRPDAALRMITGRDGAYDRTARIQILAGMEREAAARDTLARLLEDASSSYVPPHLLATAYAALGDTARAMDRLEEAYRVRDPALIWVHLDPALDPLHGTPRFQALLRRMGLASE